MANQQPSGDVARARPTTVKLAVILFYVVAALQLLGAVLYLVYADAIRRGTEKATAGTTLEGQGSGALGTVAPVVIGLVFTVLFVVVAVLVNRGSRVGRILAWVLSGISLCCVGSVYAFSTVLGESAYNTSRDQDPALPPWDEYNRLLTSELPGWYTTVTTLSTVLAGLAILVAAVLLALPASNAFFRAPAQPEWEPPVAGTPPFGAGPGDTPPSAPGAPGDGPPPARES